MFASRWEDQFCKAISSHAVVEVRYDDDLLFRSYEPTVVYRSTKDNICVGGNQTQNPNEMADEPGWHVFSLAKVTDLRVTDRKFVPDPRFNRFDARYKNGIICSV